MSLNLSSLPLLLPDLTIKIDDIANVEADIIVTSASVNDFGIEIDPMSCTLNAALQKKAGSGLHASCQMISCSRNLKPGEVIETPGFNLKCKAIFHILLPKYDGSNQQIISNAIQHCLNNADRHKYSQIVFPAIGTGFMGYPIDVVADIFKKTFTCFRGKYINNILIVIRPNAVLAINVFTKIFQISKLPAEISLTESDSSVSSSNSATPRRRLKRRTKPSKLRVVVKQGDLLASTCDVVVNPVSSNFALDGSPLSSQILAKAGPSIKTQSENNPLHHSLYYRVTDGGNLQFKNIIHLASPTKVKDLEPAIESVLNLADEVLRVDSLAIPAISTGNAGLDCVNVALAMNSVLQRFKSAKALYLHRVEIVVFNDHLVDTFESCLRELTAADDSAIPFKKSKPSRKKQTRKSASSSKDGLPPHWDPMAGKQCIKVQLAPSSKEYQQVREKFLATSNGFAVHILKIYRVQNVTLYAQYVAQKIKTKKNYPKKAPASLYRELFHGTKGTLCPLICSEGFDRGHSGENGHKFGKGSYFATTSQYSHMYAVPNTEGVRCMFLADVVVGEHCIGDPSFKVPPLKPGFSTERFDSVVDTLPDPSVFVIFKDASAYPTYLISYIQL